MVNNKPKFNVTQYNKELQKFQLILNEEFELTEVSVFDFLTAI